MSIEVRAFAKINWSLRITGRRPDGYHDLETLFQAISLHDTLTFTPAEGLSLTCDDASVPAGETNLVMRAARALGSPAVAIAMQKRIPAGGGLGGGSSDAAATLVALDALLELRTPPERLREIALSLGSDVPFFLVGGTAHATGRGEVLTPLAAVAPVPLLLLFPEERVATAEAFRRVRGFSAPVGLERYRTIVADDLLAHPDVLTNDFEPPIFELYPHLRALKQRLLATGAAWAGMTGSGSTIVGAYRSPSIRDAAKADFEDVRCVAAETIGEAVASGQSSVVSRQLSVERDDWPLANGH